MIFMTGQNEITTVCRKLEKKFGAAAKGAGNLAIKDRAVEERRKGGQGRKEAEEDARFGDRDGEDDEGENSKHVIGV